MAQHVDPTKTTAQQAKKDKYKNKAYQKLVMSILNAAKPGGTFKDDTAIVADEATMTFNVMLNGKVVGSFSKLQVEEYAYKLQQEEEVIQPKPLGLNSYLKQAQDFWTDEYTTKKPKKKNVKSLNDLYEIPYSCGRKAKQAAEADAKVDKLLATAPTDEYQVLYKSCGCAWQSQKYAKAPTFQVDWGTTVDVTGMATYTYEFRWVSQFCNAHQPKMTEADVQAFNMKAVAEHKAKKQAKEVEEELFKLKQLAQWKYSKAPDVVVASKQMMDAYEKLLTADKASKQDSEVTQLKDLAPPADDSEK